MENNNPNNICTWDEQADCPSCKLNDKLACKWDKKILCGFHGIVWPSIIMSVFGMVIK